MNNSETICAVVVTFNRKKLLIECLDALRRQTKPLDAIYIIDNNSNDGTPALLLNNGYIESIAPDNIFEPWEAECCFQNSYTLGIIKIHYVRMNVNTGGAGGFHEGVKRSFSKGYDWFWLMDDDCLVDEKCLRLLHENTSSDEGSVPAKYDIKLMKPTIQMQKLIDNERDEFATKFFSMMLPFNGFYINKKIIGLIGYPLKSFKIDRDDIEYSCRLNKFNFKTYVITNAILYHPNETNHSISVFGKKIVLINWGQGDKIYYKIRNSIFIYRLHPKLFSFKILLKVILKEVIILIWVETSFLRFKLLLKGIADGFLFNLKELNNGL